MDPPPGAEGFLDEFVKTIRSTGAKRPPGSERARADNQTMAELLKLLGRKHAIAILHQFATGDGPLRYSDIEDAIDVAPNTLSSRLSELTDAGLLERRSYDEIPPRVEYRPTEKARELAPVFWYLGVWTERHDLKTGAGGGD